MKKFTKLQSLLSNIWRRLDLENNNNNTKFYLNLCVHLENKSARLYKNLQKRDW